MAKNEPNRVLGPKEQAVFKSILTHYESKQYKKGLKLCDQILKLHPEHGETTAMKGLFFSHLDQKKEAYDQVKLGLRYDLTSPVCWHVYGLLYRADKQYEDAVKCYKNALKYDGTNVQVMKDLAFLELQMRNYDGFISSMQKLLQLRSNQRTFWIGFALANVFKKQYDVALNVLNAYEDSVQLNSAVIDYEHSEFVLYKCHVLNMSGKPRDALKYLQAQEPKICDKLAYMEQRASLNLSLNNYETAERLYEELIDRNPENRSYHEALLKILAHLRQVSSARSVTDVYYNFVQKYPKSNMVARIQLLKARPEFFGDLLDSFMSRFLRKGAPALFVLLEPMYDDAARVDAIQKLSLQYLNNLKSSGKLHESDKVKDEPTVELWLEFYLAHHYIKLQNLDKAMAHIEAAIVHTPTCIECYMLKARILKHMKKPQDAAIVMNSVRLMDLQDRFVNTKAVKYYLRANQIEEGEKLIAPFAKHGTYLEKMADLHDMQCLWFLMEKAEAFNRLGDYGRALKYFMQVVTVYDEIWDDQFDFHTYCLRKMTLRSYTEFLAYEDQLFKLSSHYANAVEKIVGIYLKLDTAMVNKLKQESPQKLAKHEETIKAYGDDTPADKVAIKKAASEQPKPVVELDPNGITLLEVKDPMAECLKLLKPLQSVATSDPRTHVLSFEVYYKQKKFLLAYKHLKKAEDLKVAIDAYKSKLDEAVKSAPQQVQDIYSQL